MITMDGDRVSCNFEVSCCVVIRVRERERESVRLCV